MTFARLAATSIVHRDTARIYLKQLNRGEPEIELSPEEQAQLERELADMQAQLANTPAEVIIANHAIGLFQLAALHLATNAVRNVVVPVDDQE